MSESAGPTSARTAIANAFKRARRRFPKNFGLTFNTNAKQADQNSEADTSSRTSIKDCLEKSSDALQRDDDIVSSSQRRLLDSSLADSLESFASSVQGNSVDMLANVGGTSENLASSTLTIETEDHGELQRQDIDAEPGVELLDMSLDPECDLRKLSLDETRLVDQQSEMLEQSQYQSMYEPMDEQVYPEEQSSFRIVWSEETIPRGDHDTEDDGESATRPRSCRARLHHSATRSPDLEGPKNHRDRLPRRPTSESSGRRASRTSYRRSRHSHQSRRPGHHRRHQNHDQNYSKEEKLDDSGLNWTSINEDCGSRMQQSSNNNHCCLHCPVHSCCCCCCGYCYCLSSCGSCCCCYCRRCCHCLVHCSHCSSTSWLQAHQERRPSATSSPQYERHQSSKAQSETKCSSCKKRSRRCSRDSGLPSTGRPTQAEFASYEHISLDEQQQQQQQSTEQLLQHKDSLCLLQQKYTGSRRSRQLAR